MILILHYIIYYINQLSRLFTGDWYISKTPENSSLRQPSTIALKILPFFLSLSLFFLDLTRSTRAEELRSIGDEASLNNVLDWKCNATSDCAVKLTSCVNGTCRCAPGYILDGSFTACIKGKLPNVYLQSNVVLLLSELLHSVWGTVCWQSKFRDIVLYTCTCMLKWTSMK